MGRGRDMDGKLETKKTKQKKNMAASDQLFDELLSDAIPIDEELTNNENGQNTDDSEKDESITEADNELNNSTEVSLPSSAEDGQGESEDQNLPQEVIDVMETLPKSDNAPNLQQTFVVSKGGKLKIGKARKGKKTKKTDFLALNENGKYQLQTLTKENAKYLKSNNKKTFSLRPDIYAIVTEVLSDEKGATIYGLPKAFINNALIMELYRIGALDKSSLSEIEEYDVVDDE